MHSRLTLLLTAIAPTIPAPPIDRDELEARIDITTARTRDTLHPPEPTPAFARGSHRVVGRARANETFAGSAAQATSREEPNFGLRTGTPTTQSTSPAPRPRTHRRGRISGAAALAVVLLVGSAGAVPASAAEYPSWEEVERARANESAKEAQVTEISRLINTLAADVAATESVARQRADAYELAQLAFDEATYRADALAQQADEAKLQATTSQRRAGALVAAWLRSGGTDLSTTLLLDGAAADDLLSKLSITSKLTETTDKIYQAARADQNTAAQLTDQAAIAQDALAGLRTDAESALEQAIDARETARKQLAEQKSTVVTLEAQLQVLQENRAATEADFTKGEAARRAAEAAAAAAAAASEGGAGGGAHGGQLSDQGWISPISGRITDPFGPRPNRPAGANPFHSGTDIGAGCGRTVVAATGGTVAYSGWLGTYGNWVLIDHGNGVQTGYAHNSSLLVGQGQSVAAGAPIALVGTTGASTGCHSHFEVRINGARVDGQPFMSARGAPLG